MRKPGRPKGTSSTTATTPVGELIKAARTGLGLGLKDVAKSTGTSLQFISNIENGRAPLPWASLIKLSKKLAINPVALVDANFKSSTTYKSMQEVLTKLKYSVKTNAYVGE